MKSKRVLIVLLILVLALATAVFFLSRKEDTGDTEEVTAVAEESIALIDCDASSVTALRWEGDAGSASLRRENDVWLWEALPDCEIDTQAVEDIAAAVCSLSADRKLDPTGMSLSDFGLEPAAAVLTAEILGTETELRIGLRNSMVGMVYVLYDGDVYLCDTELDSLIALDGTDLITESCMPDLSYTDVTELRFSDGHMILSAPEQLEEVCYSDSYSRFALDEESGTYTALSSSAVNSWLRKWLSPNMTCLGRADRPEASIEVEIFYETESTDEDGEETVSDSGSFVICLGPIPEENASLGSGDFEETEKTEEEPVLLWTDLSELTWQISASDARALVNVTEEDFLPEDICAIEFSELKSLVFVSDDGECRIDIQTDEEGEAVYLLNGAAVEQAEASALYGTLRGLDVEATTADSSLDPDDAALTVKLYRDRENWSVMTLCLIPYDSSFYVVDFAGEQRLLVNVRDVEELLTQLRETLN